MKLYMLLIRVAHQSKSFSDLPLLALKFILIKSHFLELTVSFSWKFTSLFSIMIHNSSVLFWHDFSHENKENLFFRLPTDLMKVQPIPHTISEITKSGFIQMLHYCLVSWKVTPLSFFKTKTVIFWTKRGHWI